MQLVKSLHERGGFLVQTIKSVGALSVAKTMGALYAALGLLFLPFFLLIGLAGSMISNQGGQNPFAGAVGMFFGLLAPVFYRVLGFIFGALGAFLYNLIAKWLGGIEVQLQPTRVQSAIG